MARIVRDQGGVNRFNQSHQMKRLSKQHAEKLIDDARHILASQLRHTHPVTPPPALDSFYVEETHDGYKAGNHDPAYGLIEFGSHPGGGDTPTLAYKPLRRALRKQADGA